MVNSGINFSISKMNLDKQFESFLCILPTCLSNRNFCILTVNVVFPTPIVKKDVYSISA